MIMLRKHIRIWSITSYFKQSSQFHASSKLLVNSEDSSTSSDSSDSDSDVEHQKAEKQETIETKKDVTETLNVFDTNERLNALLQKISQVSKSSEDSSTSVKGASNVIDVALKPKNIRFQKFKVQKPVKEKPFEEQLIGAAKDVAKTIGGDTQKTEAELLSIVLNVEKPTTDKKDTTTEETSETPLGLSDLLSGMRVDRSKPAENYQEKRKQIVNNLRDRFKEPSIAESVLHGKSINKPERFAKQVAPELNVVHSKLNIFKNISEQQEQPKDRPELLTWKAMELREMKLATLTTPQNVFQELIQWTEQGKLWHFPINNEQGMEKEEQVHFSEHVFMERHLKDWCPRRGPIRHFMELVCTGLSKNPYMTVEEKVGHITWYRDYFENKKDLLHELGVLDDKAATLTSQDKKQIEA